MDKQGFEELLKLMKESNRHLETISSRLDKINDTLEKMKKGETKKKRSSIFDL